MGPATAATLPSPAVTERLVLWDVDGTLLRAGPVASSVFDVAVERALGRHPGAHGVAMSGKTDPQIALEILAAAEVHEDEAGSHLPAILRHLEDELAAAAERIREEGHVLPGVVEVLSRLHDDPGVLQTVLTGNVAGNAAVKLGAFGLERWLDLEVGAFGSDDADRRALVPVAMERARRHRGRQFTPEQVWVVGDTPGDLACARAGGARCLLVASGRIPADVLEEAGPDLLLPDLSDTDRVLEVLTG